MKSLFKTLFRKAGYEIVNLSRPNVENLTPPDFGPTDKEAYFRVRPFTMTTPERVFALCRAVEHVVARKIPGDIVECGVWKGGSMMAIAATLLRLGRSDVPLHLYDTFEGMTQPVEADGAYAVKTWNERRREGSDTADWAYAPYEEARRNVLSTGYPEGMLRFIKGKVEDTIPAQAPERIALLRLDTDFYESTKHEMIHLYPRLSPGGILIVDDYGSFPGSRKAVDEYLAEHGIGLFLHRIDSDARMAVKP